MRLADKLPYQWKEWLMEIRPGNRELEALIIEDEVDICFLLTGILRKKNFKTAFVNTIREAENKLQSQNPDILFLDNNLPDGLGVDFIHRIKNTHPLSKIIMITANDTTADKYNALNAGADFFIGKPFTRDTINKTLDILLASVLK
jgi:DNA-binding response OmpR family regulator